jgi:hypothetical protein
MAVRLGWDLFLSRKLWRVERSGGSGRPARPAIGRRLFIDCAMWAEREKGRGARPRFQIVGRAANYISKNYSQFILLAINIILKKNLPLI